MKFLCEACKSELVCKCDEEVNLKTSLPHQWHRRCIDERDYVLCDVCGNIRHFKGGVSAYLTECLGLPETARADVSDEIAASPRSRKRPRRNWNFG